jgi:hypothetical protein
MANLILKSTAVTKNCKSIYVPELQDTSALDNFTFLYNHFQYLKICIPLKYVLFAVLQKIPMCGEKEMPIQSL